MSDTLGKVARALKLSIFSFSASNNLLESFIRWDFKIGDNRINLMQMCFSPVASIWLIVLLFLTTFDPFQSVWRLSDLFAVDSAFLNFMLDGRLNNMIIVFCSFFVLEWVLRKEFLIIFALGFFISRGEAHLNMTVAAMAGVILSRLAYYMWAGLDLDSEAKAVWLKIHRFQLFVFTVWVATVLWALDYAQTQYLFQQSGLLTRLNFFIFAFASFQILVQLILSAWGHFYFKQFHDPGVIRINYSSANFILRFGISKTLLKQVVEVCKVQIQKNEQHLKELAELKTINPAIIDTQLHQAIETAQRFLKEAQARAVRA